MGGGLVMTKLGEASPRRFASEAFLRENLPYIMGTISLLVIILATAVSSATAVGTVTIETSTSGSVMGHSSFSWSGMPVPGLMGPLTIHQGLLYNYNFWPEEPSAADDLWTPSTRWSTRYCPGRYSGWYNQHPTANDLSPDLMDPAAAGSD